MISVNFWLTAIGFISIYRLCWPAVIPLFICLHSNPSKY